jgi:hypothetical protein
MLRVFENKVLKKMFGLKRRWLEMRKLHNMELYDLYISAVLVMKSRIMRWQGHGTCMERREKCKETTWKS